MKEATQGRSHLDLAHERLNPRPDSCRGRPVRHLEVQHQLQSLRPGPSAEGPKREDRCEGARQDLLGARQSGAPADGLDCRDEVIRLRHGVSPWVAKVVGAASESVRVHMLLPVRVHMLLPVRVPLHAPFGGFRASELDTRRRDGFPVGATLIVGNIYATEVARGNRHDAREEQGHRIETHGKEAFAQIPQVNSMHTVVPRATSEDSGYSTVSTGIYQLLGTLGRNIEDPEFLT